MSIKRPPYDWLDVSSLLKRLLHLREKTEITGTMSRECGGHYWNASLASC
jgi:hypothetical protein